MGLWERSFGVNGDFVDYARGWLLALIPKYGAAICCIAAGVAVILG